MSIFTIAGLRMTSEDSPKGYSRSSGKSQKHLSYNDNLNASSESSTTTISSTSSNTSLSSPGLPRNQDDNRPMTSLDDEPRQKTGVPPQPQPKLSPQCSSTIHLPGPPVWPPYSIYPPQSQLPHMPPPQAASQTSQVSQTSTDSRHPYYSFYCLPAAYMQPPGTATSAGGTAATAQSPMPPASFISFPIRPMMAPWFPAYPMPSTSTATAAPGSADTSAMEVSGMTQKSSMTPIGFPPTSPDVVWMVPWIPQSYYPPGYSMVPPHPDTLKHSACGPVAQKSVALQTGESLSENSQTVYTSAEDEFQITKSNSSNQDNGDSNHQNHHLIANNNANTSGTQRTSLETASATEDSIADISFSFASQHQQVQHSRSMFLSNHYGPDKLLHGAAYALGGVNRSASFNTGDQLRIDLPSAMLRIPRSQPFYPGIYVWSHGDDVEVPQLPSNTQTT